MQRLQAAGALQVEAPLARGSRPPASSSHSLGGLAGSSTPLAERSPAESSGRKEGRPPALAPGAQGPGQPRPRQSRSARPRLRKGICYPITHVPEFTLRSSRKCQCLPHTRTMRLSSATAGRRTVIIQTQTVPPVGRPSKKQDQLPDTLLFCQTLTGRISPSLLWLRHSPSREGPVQSTYFSQIHVAFMPRCF